jgi:hypothetical protein
MFDLVWMWSVYWQPNQQFILFWGRDLGSIRCKSVLHTTWSYAKLHYNWNFSLWNLVSNLGTCCSERPWAIAVLFILSIFLRLINLGDTIKYKLIPKTRPMHFYPFSETKIMERSLKKPCREIHDSQNILRTFSKIDRIQIIIHINII